MVKAIAGAAVTLAILIGRAEAAPVLPTAVDPDSVAFLNDACHQEPSSAPARFCAGYLEAAAQFMVTNGFELGKVEVSDTEAVTFLRAAGLCGGPSVGVPSGGALTGAFLAWAEAHPERRAERALAGVVTAFETSWPCATAN